MVKISTEQRIGLLIENHNKHIASIMKNFAEEYRQLMNKYIEEVKRK